MRGILTKGVVLLHDNARPHTARRTAAVLTEFGWELFDYPSYSSDLAPSDFHVFLLLKKLLSSVECFGNDEELKTSVTRLVPFTGGRVLQQRDTKVDPTTQRASQFW
ncbi:histone-lysine N-methyltransferase SETMAR [Trichonephila clavipes]|nr:histone-lysine N-methyltransferase SETMAR [Trichonephila clavipes]